MSDYTTSIPQTTQHGRSASPNTTVRSISIETLLWGILLLTAIWTRFHDLGSRAQHHDESLHSYYSWVFSTGSRLYTHDPMMHGPFLFHANALIYRLFGASDYTSRILPAVFGVIIVGLPWLLRSPRLLGRWGALTAGFMLLISPSMLYYTRFIRHDPYMVAGCLLLTIAIFRFLEHPQRRWVVIGFATISFLLTNHELVLATFLIMFAIMWGALVLTRLPLLVPVHLIALFLLTLAAWLWAGQAFPPIPWNRPDSHALTFSQMLVFIKVLGPVALAVVAVMLVIALEPRPIAAGIESIALSLFGIGWIFFARRYVPLTPDWEGIPDPDGSTFLTTSEFYWSLLQHPLIQAVLVIAILFLVGCFVTIRWMLRGKPEGDDALGFILKPKEPGTIAYGVYHALRDPMGITIGILVALVIWVLLFTTFFTNPQGIGSGTYETNSTLLYWLGQHDVRRGSQPWFYFIILGLQYEWLSVTLAAAGTGLLAWRLILWLAGGDHGPQILWSIFIVGWFTGMLLVISWAGEKMPWLIMHAVLPAALVSGWLISIMVRNAQRWIDSQGDINQQRTRSIPVLFTVCFMLLGFGWFYKVAEWTYPIFELNIQGTQIRAINPQARDSWWQIAIIPIVAIAIILLVGVISGWKRTLYATFVSAFIVMSLFQIHAGVRSSFTSSASAVDTLIYNTIGDDFTQMIDDMNRLSEEIYGDNSIAIVYDSCQMQWPANWYLRQSEFPNARFSRFENMGTPDVVLVAQDSRVCDWPDRLPGYTAQTYAMRVHEAESVSYRNFAIAPELAPDRSAWGIAENPHDFTAVIKSIISSVTYLATPEGQQKAFRQIMFRDQSGRQSVYYMTVWMRNDLLPVYNDIRYGEVHP